MKNKEWDFGLIPFKVKTNASKVVKKERTYSFVEKRILSTKNEEADIWQHAHTRVRVPRSWSTDS